MLFRISIRVTMGVLALSLLSALLAAVTYGLNYNCGGDDKSYGFNGSVKGRVFTGTLAGGWFNVGSRDGIRFNLDNFSSQTYQLKMIGPQGVRRLSATPGLTRLRVPAQSGPVFLRFQWDRSPRGVIMTRLDTREYRFFKRALTTAMFAAGVLLLLTWRNRAPRMVFAAAFVFFLGLFFNVFHNALIPLTGDEPHYMIQAESIARDGDLNIADNHARRYHASYFPGALQHHGVGDRGRASGVLRSVHFPLLSVILYPAFAPRFQINHYVVAKFIMQLITAGVAAGLLVFIGRMVSGWTAIPAVLVLICAPPFLPYTNQIFPEVPAGGLLFLAGLHVLSKVYPGKLPAFAQSPVPAAVCLALLPLLHLKFAAAALGGGCGLLWMTGGGNSRTRLFVVGGILVLGALASSTYSVWAYGSLLGPYTSGAGTFLTDALRRYTVYFLDADRGLFALAPLLLAAPAGLLVLFRRHKPAGVVMTILIFAGHLPNLFHPNWLLGSGPVGRYWVAVLPLLMVCAVIGCAHIFRRSGPAIIAGVLAGLSSLRSLGGTGAFLLNQEAFYGPTPEPFIVARFIGTIPGLDALREYFLWSYPGAMPLMVPGVAVVSITIYILAVRKA